MKKIPLILIVLSLILLGLFLENLHRIPPEFGPQTILYLGVEGDENGRLMVYDPQRAIRYPLTSAREIVNQFTLYPRLQGLELLYLSIPKKKLSGAFSVLPYQSLYRFDLQTGKKRKITPPKAFQISFMHEGILGDRAFFQLKSPDKGNQLWTYRLEIRSWDPFYEGLPLQDLDFSAQSSLVLGANPDQNLGFGLFPLGGTISDTTPIGNYWQNFGFSPDGTRILLGEKADQDIFSQKSSLLVFDAGGSTKSLLMDRGEIVGASWGQDNQTIYVGLRDEAGHSQLLEIDLETGKEALLQEFETHQVEGMRFKKNHLWVVSSYRDQTDFEMLPGQDLQSMLEHFGSMSKHYQVWKISPEGAIKKLPFEGLFPTPLYPQ